MRRLAAPAAALLSVGNFVTAPSARAATSMRDWVPESQLAPYRALAPQYADPSQLGSGWGEVVDLNGISCIADPAGIGALPPRLYSSPARSPSPAPAETRGPRRKQP